MRSGPTFCCWKSNFCGEFSARFRKFKNYVEKKKDFTPKKKKNDERLLFETSYNRNSENEFLER